MGAETVDLALSWVKQEPGWYTSEIGGVCREDNGWWFYPSGWMREGMMNFSGPFPTKSEAIIAAEARR